MAVNASDYYRSLDDANKYFDDQLFSTDWTASTVVEADKERALLAAARAIDSVQFKGDKVPVFDILAAGGSLIDNAVINSTATQAQIETADATQKKEWPRDGDEFAPVVTSAIQTLFAYVLAPSSGNFTLKITLADTFATDVSFTTAAIAFDATASTIETAIDTAATGVVTGWTNGDISVSGGPLSTADADIVITFDGDSVKDLPHSARPVVSPDATFLVDGTLTVPATKAVVTGECPDRVFFAQCEEAVSLLSNRDPQQEFENLTLTSDGVSTTRVSIDRSNMPPQHTAHLFTSALAWKYLQEFLDNDNPTFDFHRI